MLEKFSFLNCEIIFSTVLIEGFGLTSSNIEKFFIFKYSIQPLEIAPFDVIIKLLDGNDNHTRSRYRNKWKAVAQFST